MIDGGDVSTGGTAVLDAAMAYARFGWSVIPVHTPEGAACSCQDGSCRSVGKHPRVPWEEWMERPAPSDRLRAWWRRWPDSNVGVVTGLVSGIAVIDIDPRNDGDRSLRDLEFRWDVLPMTTEVRTGGGGTHLWFRLGVDLTSSVLAPGVELKAGGGMVVAPPSLHESGQRYVWRPGGHPDELQPSRLPEWVADLAAGRTRHAARPVTVRTVAEREEFRSAWERAGIELRPGDRYYRCPFHDDHHPSLHIDAEGCRWYCFGCGEGGGIGRLAERLGEDRRPRPRSRLRRRMTPGRPITLPGDHEVDVVGESRHQDELLLLTGGRRRYGGVDAECVAELVPEPANRFDPRAIGVYIDGHHVGYIRRGDVEWLRPHIEESRALYGVSTCRAVIRGGWDRGHGAVGMFGVTLLLPNPGD